MNEYRYAYDPDRETEIPAHVRAFDTTAERDRWVAENPQERRPMDLDEARPIMLLWLLDIHRYSPMTPIIDTRQIVSDYVSTLRLRGMLGR